MPMVRTFVAIELTPQVLERLADTQARLQRGPGGRAGRWVRPEGIHLTLKFLGDVAEEKLGAVYEAVRQACEGHSSVPLEIAGLGCFPNARRPRVVWVGVREGTGQLAALQRDIEARLERLGYPPEGRTFTPHLTLARVRQEALRSEVEALGRSVSESDVDLVAEMLAESVHVMKSDLQPGGAVYTELLRAPLGHPDEHRLRCEEGSR